MFFNITNGYTNVCFVMLKNVGQNIILLILNQNQLNILLITKHTFLCSILLAAPKDGRARKNFEAFFIAKLKPSLNRQEDSNMLNLFRNGVT